MRIEIALVWVINGLYTLLRRKQGKYLVLIQIIFLTHSQIRNVSPTTIDTPCLIANGGMSQHAIFWVVWTPIKIICCILLYCYLFENIHNTLASPAVSFEIHLIKCRMWLQNMNKTAWTKYATMWEMGNRRLRHDHLISKRHQLHSSLINLSQIVSQNCHNSNLMSHIIKKQSRKWSQICHNVTLLSQSQKKTWRFCDFFLVAWRFCY